jgi:hypothetical protein
VQVADHGPEVERSKYLLFSVNIGDKHWEIISSKVSDTFMLHFQVRATRRHHAFPQQLPLWMPTDFCMAGWCLAARKPLLRPQFIASPTHFLSPTSRRQHPSSAVSNHPRYSLTPVMILR